MPRSETDWIDTLDCASIIFSLSLTWICVRVRTISCASYLHCFLERSVSQLRNFMDVPHPFALVSATIHPRIVQQFLRCPPLLRHPFQHGAHEVQKNRL